MALADFDRVIDRRQTASLKWELYKDRDILPMWVADMDFAAPPCVLEALQQRLDHGVLAYTVPPQGLVETVVERAERFYGWQIKPHWIVWLPGLVVGLNLASRCVGQAQDEVLSFTPVYPPFLSAPRFSDRQLVKVPLDRAGDRMIMDPQRFRSSLTDRSRVMLLCHPHNPVGRSYGPDELRRIAEICVEHDLVICSDEIHCDLVLDEVPHVPTATLSDEIAQRTITLMAPSKTFNLPGLDCAFAIIPNDTLRRRFTDVRRGIVPYVNVFGYCGAEAAYRHGEPWHQELLQYLRGNRDLLEQTIADLPNLSMNHVEATYLAWIDARQLNVPNPHRFFEDAGVGLSDGKEFDGEGFVRLNFGCPRSILEEGLRRIKDAVAQLS